MEISIERLARSSASELYDDPKLKNIFEDHLTWLINHHSTTTVAVTAHHIEVYDFDWIGLLNALNVKPDMHWIVIRMNGGKSLTDVPQELRALLVPDHGVIQNIISLNNSTKKIR